MFASKTKMGNGSAKAPRAVKQPRCAQSTRSAGNYQISYPTYPNFPAEVSQNPQICGSQRWVALIACCRFAGDRWVARQVRSVNKVSTTRLSPWRRAQRTKAAMGETGMMRTPLRLIYQPVLPKLASIGE